MVVTVVEGVVAAEAVAVVVEVVAEEAVVAGDVDEVSRCGERRQRLKAKKTTCRCALQHHKMTWSCVMDSGKLRLWVAAHQRHQILTRNRITIRSATRAEITRMRGVRHKDWCESCASREE